MLQGIEFSRLCMLFLFAFPTTDYQCEVDSEISSASFAFGSSSDRQDITGSQSYQSIDEKALYEESRRLVEELDTRIVDLSSEDTKTIEDTQQQKQKCGNAYVLLPLH